MKIKELEYPIDSDLILRKKKAFTRRLLENGHFKKLKIAVLGGSTTSEIVNILYLFLLNEGFKAEFYESEYSKYYEDSVFPNVDLEKFQPDIIYIHTSVVNLTFPTINDSSDNVQDLFNSHIDKFTQIWEALKKYNCPIIQNNFEYPAYRSLGNLDCSVGFGKTNFISRLNLEFSKLAIEEQDLYINDINYLSSYIGIQNWLDLPLWYESKYAVSFSAIPELVLNLSKIICSIIGNSKKCLILDLDNTCWGGVIAEDGINGIKIGPDNPIAQAHSDFQKYVVELQRRGVTLAVCSKNDVSNAKSGLSHPNSSLTMQDFSSFKANWLDKHINISNIANEINLGLDSFVFIDDNAAERELILSQVPEVLTPDIGNDITNYIKHIDRNLYFEPTSISTEDTMRSSFYKSNSQRVRDKKKYNSYDDFLVSLKMQAEIKPFNKVYYDRISQLANKTNQFNLTAKRYTKKEIIDFSTDENSIALYGKLSDKFGDNGVVSLIIGSIKNDTCHIELFVMSCRVLKRGMEMAMMELFVQSCIKKNVTEIEGRYAQTKKNSMVKELYKQFGFLEVEKKNGSSIWRCSAINVKNIYNSIGIN